MATKREGETMDPLWINRTVAGQSVASSKTTVRVVLFTRFTFDAAEVSRQIMAGASEEKENFVNPRVIHPLK